jgi:large subunit ribosomal protein L1
MSFNLEDAFLKLKDSSFNKDRKFNQSFDVAVMLGIDPKQSTQNVKGSVVAPKGLGKESKVLILTSIPQKEEELKKEGASYVGAEDLISKISTGFLDFDYCLATPEMMQKISKVARKLGPRGLMPSKKDGTVTDNINEALKECLSGKIAFKNDKNGIIHCSIGKMNFSVEEIKENIKALVDKIKSLKPESSKGQYIKKIVLSTTMGPSVEVKLETLYS